VDLKLCAEQSGTEAGFYVIKRWSFSHFVRDCW